MSNSPSTANAPQGASQNPPVNRRHLGVPAITFMIIAASAPLTVLAGGTTTDFAVTGVKGVPLAFLLLGAVLALFTVGYAAMSRYVTNAGAFYSYVSQGLSKPVGVGASILALIAYNVMQIGIYGLIGYQVSSFINEKFPSVNIPWWIPVIVCIVIIGILGVNRVDLSAKVLAVLVGCEFAVVIIYDIVAFAVHPDGMTTQGIAPSSLFVNGIGAVLAFGIAAFMGFESAAIYSEEAKDPRHTIARATYSAVAIIAIFYCISAFAMIISVGPNHIIEESSSQGPGLMFGFIQTHLGGVLNDIAQLLFITSLFAALQSFHNAVARYFFALGREGVLHRWLGKLRHHGAPWAGSLTQSVLAVVVIVIFAIIGAHWTPPKGMGADMFPVLTLFTWLTNDGALGLVLLMATVSVAVVGYFITHRTEENAWQRIIAPVISGVALIALFVLIVLNFNLLLTSDPSAPVTAATFVLPAIVVVPALIGILWGFYLKAKRPRAYERIGLGVSPEKAAEGDDTTHSYDLTSP